MVHITTREEMLDSLDILNELGNRKKYTIDESCGVFKLITEGDGKILAWAETKTQVRKIIWAIINFKALEEA